MSHWVKAKVETLKNIKMDFFNEALKEMGYYADFEKHEVRNYYRSNGDDQYCDCVLMRISDGSNSQIGMKFEADQDNNVKVTVMSDWHTSYGAERFMSTFTKEYVTVQTKDTCARLGYKLDSVVEEENNTRLLVMKKAA